MSPRDATPWVVATSSPGKLREIRALFSGLAELRPLAELPPVELPEEGDDYATNARTKALTVAVATGLPTLADDSGLEVDALGGAPGPRSARYGGPGLDDAGRVARLLAELSEVPRQRRGARFVCVAAWADPHGVTLVAEGRCEGVILAAPRGDGGFGYDPVFQPLGEACSMAELTAERKNQLSHRARAFRALAELLAGRSPA